jgi:signal transduction histidine kinase/ActR/RegA family two-component response regulator
LIRRETSKLARWVVVAGITLIALIIVADAHEAWLDYRSALSDNERIQQALGRVLAEQTARMMQETDVVLSDYGDWVVSIEGRKADEESLRERLRADVMRLPFIYSASLAGANGRVLATTDAASRETVEVPPTALKDSLYIGKPFDGTHDEARTFALSRQIAATNGDFSGVVLARVAFEYLTGFYASVDATPDTSIRLLRDDGVVLAQDPSGNGTTSGASRVRQIATRLAQDKEQVLYRTADGRDEVAAVRAVEGYPVIIEVTRPMSSILSPWVQEEAYSAARTLALVLLAGVLMVALRAALLRHAGEEQERRRLERELNIAQRLDALGFLAASVAHDFNNVLSAIVGYGELGRTTMAADSEELANMDRLLAAAERARLLVRRVLTFDPRRSLEYAPLPLKPILVEIAQQVEASLPPSVTLHSRGFDLPAFVRGDATEIHQVVMNLCTNAVHAMPSGGRLEMELTSIELQEARSLTLGRLLPGEWVCLAIADAGVGLNSEQINSIFEPFYTTRGSEQGTGIGLTVVRNILTRMRGALDVQSRVGAGTRICVYWQSTMPGIDVTDAQNDAPQAGHGETVLVVDDKPELVSLIEDVLASLGYEPVGFTDARAALKAFRSQPKRFDALVTDERMQGLSGCELAKKIHKIDPQLPVILVTGYRDADTLLRAKDAGVAEILDKPLNTHVLAAALSRQLTAGNANGSLT